MSAASARAMRVLVVDDDADTVESTALMLQSDGHEVATADDTLHTLVRVMSLHPELVLLDLSMPKIDGFRLARQIQHLPLRTTHTSWQSPVTARPRIRFGLPRLVSICTSPSRLAWMHSGH